MAVSFITYMRVPARMVLLVVVCLLLSCSVDDPRDECCTMDMLQFRFLHQGSDCFSGRIRKMQYHLFGTDGTYIREMAAYEGDLSRVSLVGLSPGTYVLVGIGNLDGYGTLTDMAVGGLHQFCLHVTRCADSSPELFGNGDPLYYGIREFTIERGKSNTFVADMAHIHCCLHLRVEWEGVPAHSEGYSFRLSGIGGGVDMHVGNASYIGALPFPGVHHYEGQMEDGVRLQNLALQKKLYTLRYTDSHIPRFTLYHHGKAVTKEIPLADVFRSWGWTPSATSVQEYQVTMQIKLNGNIEIRQGFKASVSDWEDGGVIGSIR